MKTDHWNYIPTLVGGVLLIIWGIIMLVNDLVGYGVHYLTQQFTAGGGWLLILIGLILLGVSYFSLSPFSKIRKFFEGK